MSSAWPLVTVIMPVRDSEDTVAHAIDSVLLQGYGPLQFIVVDDGSADETPDILAGYGQRIELLVMDGRGPAAARNLALERARGELVAFIDADDVWWPGKLFAQVAYMQKHPEVAVTFGRFERWQPTDQGQDALNLPDREAYAMEASRWTSALQGTEPMQGHVTTALQGCLYAELLLDSVVHIITAMIRRSLVLQHGAFDSSLARGSDYEFWLRHSRHSTMVQLDMVMASYRVHARSLTKQPWVENGEFMVLERAINSYGLQAPDGRRVSETIMRKRLGAIAFGHGYLLFWLGRFAESRTWFSKALNHGHFNVRAGVYWVLTWLGPALKILMRPGDRLIGNSRQS